MSYIKLYTDELKNKGLSLYDKAVYGSLVTKYQYHGNKEFYTFESYIADELEISERTVKRSIKKLTEVKLITISKRYHKQLKQTVNYYNLDIDNLANTNLIDTNADDTDTAYNTTDTDNSITQTEITAQIENNNDYNNNNATDIKQEEITDTDYMDIMNEITLPVVKLEKERIAEAIEQNYNIDGITKIADIKFDKLMMVADTAEADPQKVLDYIKEIRQIA